MIPRVSFICGAAHSGSTLLGLVLGSHDDAFYAGEAKKTLFLHDPEQPLRKRVCKMCGPDCAIWRDFPAQPTPDLYGELQRRTDRPWIIDSTKSPRWIASRAQALDQRGIRVDLIFIKRDGRAVLGSRLRKYPDRPVDQQIDHWIEQIAATRRLLATRPGFAHCVRYEELATRPEATIRTLCDKLEVNFSAEMLAYEAKVHHPLGGNNGTQWVAARARGGDSFARLPERSRGFYGGLRGGYRLDTRWRSELAADARQRFEQRAGELNAAFEWNHD